MRTGLLLSGGIDSTALTYWLRPDIAFTVDYGQLGAKGEIHAAAQVCKALEIEHEIISVDCRALGSGDLFGEPPDSLAPVQVVDNSGHRPHQTVQYLAIDKFHRIRARKAYNNATQQNSIDFINHLLKQIANPIHCIRTDSSLVFSGEFSKHLKTLRLRHEYIAPYSIKI